MRKIIFYGAVSLDGYLATKTDDLQWLFDTPTGEQTTYEAFYETIDTTIMGRKTYQEAKKYLETEAIYPEKKEFRFFQPMHNYNCQMLRLYTKSLLLF